MKYSLSRRHFCFCCVGAAGYAATAGWLTPRQAYAEARGIVSLIKDSAATSPIITHRVRDNFFVLEGSGGNIAVLAGSDDKVLVDAGISVSRPQMTQALACAWRRTCHALDQHALALRSQRRKRMAPFDRCGNYRAREHAQASFRGPTGRRLGLQLPSATERGHSDRGLCERAPS